MRTAILAGSRDQRGYFKLVSLLMSSHSVYASNNERGRHLSPAGVRAVLATGKSVSGALAMVGSVVAGVQVLIAAAETPSSSSLTLTRQRHCQRGTLGGT